MLDLWHTKKRRSKLRLALGFAAFSLFSAASYAAGNIAVVTNDDKVEKGEELGITLVIGGDGTYDVYGAVVGGVFPEIFVFGPTGLVPLSSVLPNPPKLKENVTIETLSTQDKIIPLLPRIPLSGFAGSYTIFGVLVPAGQPVMDHLDNLDLTTVVAN